MKIGNKEEKEDPMKSKEKEIIERIKLKYKGENKRQAEDDKVTMIKKSKKIRISKEENDENDKVLDEKVKIPSMKNDQMEKSSLKPEKSDQIEVLVVSGESKATVATATEAPLTLNGEIVTQNGRSMPKNGKK